MYLAGKLRDDQVGTYCVLFYFMYSGTVKMPILVLLLLLLLVLLQLLTDGEVKLRDLLAHLVTGCPLHGDARMPRNVPLASLLLGHLFSSARA